MFLCGRQLWNAVGAAAQTARGRRFVATPYLTAGVVKVMRFQRGDVLLCALTLANCRAGSVDPHEVKRLRRRGVSVYSLDELHAKIFLLGTRAIIGSANLTVRSRDVLDEAAIMVEDRKSIGDVRAWFGARLHSPVQTEWLAKCIAAYRPPRGAAGPQGRQKRRATAERGRGVLLAALVPRRDDPKDERVVAEGRSKAKRLLEHERLSDIEDIRWSGGREFRVGDVIIQMLRDGDETWVSPHARVIHLRRRKLANGTRRSFVFLELPRHYRRMRFKVFKKRCRAFGLEVGTRRTRTVSDPGLVQRLLLLTSPAAMRRR